MIAKLPLLILGLPLLSLLALAGTHNPDSYALIYPAAAALALAPVAAVCAALAAAFKLAARAQARSAGHGLTKKPAGSQAEAQNS